MFFTMVDLWQSPYLPAQSLAVAAHNVSIALPSRARRFWVGMEA